MSSKTQIAPIPYEEISKTELRKAYRLAEKNFNDFLALWRGEQTQGFGEAPKLTYETRRIHARIQNYAKAHDYSDDQIINECTKSALLQRELFYKDPRRQSIHQKTAVKYMKDWIRTSHMENFSLLKSSGPTSKHLSGGRVILQDDLSGSKKTNKSIDFEWTYAGTLKKPIVFYATHKYTEQDGGSQDNQKNDLVQFVQGTAQSSDTKNEYVFFFAIADGPYYQKSSSEPGRQSSRLEELKSHTTNNNKCFVMESHLVPRKCLELIAHTYKMEGKEVPRDIRESLLANSQLHLDLSAVMDRQASIAFEDEPVTPRIAMRP
jgi:hypothetical protein